MAEVLANIEAMELAVEETAAQARITTDSLLAIHESLMRRAANASIAGQVRDVQNWIGGNDYNPCGADFVPPPPDHVAELLDDLCEFCNSDRLPPLIQAAIDGLTQYRDGDLDEWIERFAVAAAQAATLAKRYLGRVQELQEAWRQQLRDHADPRADGAAWAVIDELPGHPVITVPVATAVTGRSKSSTAVAVDQLVDAGILHPLSESKRNRAWEADGLLDLLAELEAGP